jgi:hypothetical protein
MMVPQNQKGGVNSNSQTIGPTAVASEVVLARRAAVYKQLESARE